MSSWVASLDPWAERFSEVAGFQQTVTLNAGAGRVLRLHGLKQGELPSYASSEDCGVVFDGVLFERADLCVSLGLDNGHYASDADLILKLYAREGEALLPKIRGLFALVIWDSRRNRCLWARDHTGVFPYTMLSWGKAGCSVRRLTSSINIRACVRQSIVSRL